MASPPSLSDYQNTGFYSTANINQLQNQLAQYATDFATNRQRAESYYSPTYEAEKQNYQNQLAELGTNQQIDAKKINTQYDKSMNQLMANLNKQGFGRSSLVSTRGVEVENARNGALSDSSLQYLRQANDINANIQTLTAKYAQDVESKAAEMQRENQASRINLLAQIAQLQQNGYNAYANYLANKQ